MGLGPKSNFDYMSREELEQYFTSIQERFNDVDKRFDEQNRILQTILDIVRVNDVERKEIKATLWEYDRRIGKLEKQLA